MKKYFYLDESPYYKNKYLIRVSIGEFPFKGTEGSYAVLPSRFLNLSYAQYLRFARDVLGAELMGKNSIYIIPYFTRSNELDQFLKLLNKRAAFVMGEREKGYIIEQDENGELVKVPIVLD